VFSPYYARARQRGPANPAQHCALNVALYRPRAKLWAMTERGQRHLKRDAHSFVLGPSRLDWDGTRLTLTIDEVTMPVPRRLRGTVTLEPKVTTDTSIALDPDGRHHWRPLAPQARISVDFKQPDMRWEGAAYLDSNQGSVPLEEDFASWNWSRCHRGDATTVYYDVKPRRGREHSHAFRFDAAGKCSDIPSPVAMSLPLGLWRVPRTARAEGRGVRLARTLEDTPFYTRSIVAAEAEDGPSLTVHESLSLDRFASPWVQVLLPFKMPRRG
jgi:carotenoid 1,2-hydratase